MPGTQNEGIASASTTNLFTIKDPKVSDSGTYTCYAQNTLVLSATPDVKIQTMSVTLVVHKKAIDRFVPYHMRSILSPEGLSICISGISILSYVCISVAYLHNMAVCVNFICLQWRVLWRCTKRV